MPRILSALQMENPETLQEVIRELRSGNVIAYPTETFYGLGADAVSERAVKRIFSIKGRDFRNPIPLIIGEERVLPSLAKEIPEAAEQLIQAFWPGPLTLVFFATPLVHPLLTAGTGKIGVRLSSNPIASSLARELGGALTATSANLSGTAECGTADEVMSRIGDRIDLMVDGGRTAGKAGSTVVDITVDPPTILRQGILPSGLIMQALNRPAR